jgi:transposase
MGHLVATLERDKEALRLGYEEARARADEERTRAEEHRARAEAAEAAAKRLQVELDLLRRKLTGPCSERVIDPNQLPLPIDPKTGLATSASAAADDTEDEGETVTIKRKKRKTNRRSIEDMNHLRTVVHHEPHDPLCPCGCAAPGVVIGQEVSWRIERVPAEIIRHKNLRDRFAFPEHRDATGTPATIWTAPPPVSYALPGAICGDGLLVQVAIDKYCDHLPLYRQAQRFQREGLDLSRQTLCDWMMAFGELLRPIVKIMAREALGGDWLRADATGMPVLDESRVKGKAHHGHLWAWGNYDVVVFTYTPDKKAETVLALFPEFEGVVLIDGATDFNLLERADGVTRAGCWAHARRKLYEALAYDAVLAMRGLAAIRELFVAERVVMAAPIEERLALREELCRPILDGIRRWVDEELSRAIPRTPMHGALQYLDNQWERLCVFLEHASIACHNNDTERDLRRPVKGKANYHFAGSPRGADVAAVFYSLIGTCLLQGIDPRHERIALEARIAREAGRRSVALRAQLSNARHAAGPRRRARTIASGDHSPSRKARARSVGVRSPPTSSSGVDGPAWSAAPIQRRGRPAGTRFVITSETHGWLASISTMRARGAHGGVDPPQAHEPYGASTARAARRPAASVPGALDPLRRSRSARRRTRQLGRHLGIVALVVADREK